MCDRHKSSSIKCLGTRAKNFCHATKLIGERNHQKQVFQASGYPAQMVNRALRNHPHASPLFHPNRRAGADHPPQVLPLIVCERCQREDREEVQEPWHQDNLQIKENLQGSLGANKRPSTRVEEERSHVSCTECESVYVGETRRTLEMRISVHKGAVRRQYVKNGITVHAWT